MDLWSQCIYRHILKRTYEQPIYPRQGAGLLQPYISIRSLPSRLILFQLSSTISDNGHRMRRLLAHIRTEPHRLVAPIAWFAFSIPLPWQLCGERWPAVFGPSTYRCIVTLHAVMISFFISPWPVLIRCVLLCLHCGQTVLEDYDLLESDGITWLASRLSCTVLLFYVSLFILSLWRYSNVCDWNCRYTWLASFLCLVCIRIQEPCASRERRCSLCILSICLASCSHHHWYHHVTFVQLQATLATYLAHSSIMSARHTPERSIHKTKCSLELGNASRHDVDLFPLSSKNHAEQSRGTMTCI